MLPESLLALASLAGQMVVEAATADEWETVHRGYAQLLGRGDIEQMRLAERRLEDTREQLAGAAGTDARLVRAALTIRWAGRLADLLEENPDAEADLRSLVQGIQMVPPAQRISADHRAASADADAATDVAGMPGPEHSGGLAARSELAYSTGQAGDAGAARDQFAALLPVAERVLGPEHAETRAMSYQLAHWTALAQDAAARARWE